MYVKNPVKSIEKRAKSHKIFFALSGDNENNMQKHTNFRSFKSVQKLIIRTEKLIIIA